MRFFLKMLLFIGIAAACNAQQKVTELGSVSWQRNLDTGLQLAKQKSLPVFLLFQEVPGCATCRSFGNDVLSHPLIVEAIETYFIPVAIFNNKGGHDAEVLARYKEPSWNNPVIRIVDTNGKDLITRHSGKYDAASAVKTINSALLQSNRLIPEFLSLLENELSSNTDEIYLEMYCFWSGEKNIGAQTGVIYTEAGYSNGREVVKVVFDEKTTNPANIAAQAKKSGNADAVHVQNKSARLEGLRQVPLTNYTVDKDIHYYLKNSEYAYLPLTPMQATKINSAIGLDKDVLRYLSPRQQQMLHDLRLGKLMKTVRYNVQPWFNAWPESYR